MPNPANPQSLNRYSYVVNNPLRYIDPTGHSGCEFYQGVCLSENQMTEIYNDTTGNGNNNNHDDDDEDEGVMDYCSTHPDSCGAPSVEPPAIPDPIPADGVTNDADSCVRHPYACGAGNPTTSSSSPQSGSSDPNWNNIAAGVLLLTGLILLVDIPLIVGLVAFFPEMEIGMVLTEAWSWPLILAVGAAHVYAVDLIIEGVTGQE